MIPAAAPKKNTLEVSTRLCFEIWRGCASRIWSACDLTTLHCTNCHSSKGPRLVDDSTGGWAVDAQQFFSGGLWLHPLIAGRVWKCQCNDICFEIWRLAEDRFESDRTDAAACEDVAKSEWANGRFSAEVFRSWSLPRLSRDHGRLVNVRAWNARLQRSFHIKYQISKGIADRVFLQLSKEAEERSAWLHCQLEKHGEVQESLAATQRKMWHRLEAMGRTMENQLKATKETTDHLDVLNESHLSVKTPGYARIGAISGDFFLPEKIHQKWGIYGNLWEFYENLWKSIACFSLVGLSRADLAFARKDCKSLLDLQQGVFTTFQNSSEQQGALQDNIFATISKEMQSMNGSLTSNSDMAMDQYLLIPFLGGWTSIYQLFWCSPGVQGFDTLPYSDSSKPCETRCSKLHRFSPCSSFGVWF